MIELLKDLKIFTDNIEDKAKEQIYKLLEQEAFKNSKIRIMPDVHSGKNCVIGFTGVLGDKVIPNIVGRDIGCGMFCANLGQIEIDYQRLDAYIHDSIPSGKNIHSKKVADFEFNKLYCYKEIKNTTFFENVLGTLGDGNHFIEIDESENGEKFLIIHTGSRSLGAFVASYYQQLAERLFYLEYEEQKAKIIEEYKGTGREKELDDTLNKIREQYEIKNREVPHEFRYLDGKYRDAYLHDMRICQEFASLNRNTIASMIASYMGWDISKYFESVHNYISFEDNIVRKGSISAKKGEPIIIPINMRDGCIIGVGKGNPDWNYSAPHGAGRIMSRRDANERISLDEYKKAMEQVYTTSVNEDTKDEAPMVYKSMSEILHHIEPTVEVVEIIKPIYNYKASKVSIFSNNKLK